MMRLPFLFSICQRMVILLKAACGYAMAKEQLERYCVRFTVKSKDLMSLTLLYRLLPIFIGLIW